MNSISNLPPLTLTPMHHEEQATERQDPFAPSEPLPSILRRRSRTDSSASIDSDQIRISLNDLEQDPYASCFIPKDSAINNNLRYQLTKNYIMKFKKNKLSHHSHITSLNILHSLANCQITEKEEALKKIFKELYRKQIITEHLEYCKNSVQLTALKNICQDSLNIKNKDFKSRISINIIDFLARTDLIDSLARILFFHLDPSTLAKIKVTADFICIFMRLNDSISPDHKLDLNYTSPFTDLKNASSLYTSPFIELSTRIRAHISTLSNLFEVKELDLSCTYIETIPPQITRLLTDIKKLKFQNNTCDSLALLTAITELATLEELDLSDNQFTSLPPSFFLKLSHLKQLNLRGNSFDPEEISRLQHVCKRREISLFI